MNDHPCAICLKPTGEDAYCFGCKAYVCEVCDQTNVLGKHLLRDHLDDGLEYDQ